MRVRVLRPLRERDFALLFTGIAVSMLGDGISLVAIAWQVYDISNVPTALSLVGVAWTLPMVLFLLVGGVLADRFDRRRLLILSDIVRGLPMAAIGVLSIAGVIELWHMIALVAVYGFGQALSAPALDATVPDVVPRPLLVQANSLYELTQPLGYRFLGPAIGGVLVGALGPGPAFLIDAGTFGFSAFCVSLMSVRRRPRPEEGPAGIRSVRRDIAEGLSFVRAYTWLWGTLLSAAVVLFLYMGPFEVLLPYVVRNEFGGGATALGLVFAASGVGAVCSSLAVAQRGIGRRHILWMYVGWTVGIGSLAFLALAASTAQAMAIAVFAGAFMSLGNVIWVTMVQTHVPSQLLGRVSSLDWLVSFGLTPASFAAAGPIAEAVGVEETMLVAGGLGAALTAAFLLLPGMRDPERWAREGRTGAEIWAEARVESHPRPLIER